MKKLISALSLVAALTGAAYAGKTVHNAVSVGASSANGSLVGARNSPDDNEFILCKVTSTGKLAVAGCYAADMSGHQGMCLTSDPGMVSVARSISAASYIWFRWDPQSGACTEIAVSNGSSHLE